MLKNFDSYNQLIHSLADIAPLIIPEGKENAAFRENPDNFHEHEPNWHEFGIITHTSRALMHYQESISPLFYKWGIWNQVETFLSQIIKGLSKRELIAVSIIYHDIGKFQRTIKRHLGTEYPSYTGHEKISKELIENNSIVFSRLKAICTDKTQLSYIGSCAALHYELGKIRKQAKQHNRYNFSFLESELFLDICKEIIADYPSYKIEIGILFLCDSLAKTDVAFDANSDSELEQDLPENIMQQIASKGLPATFVNAIKQQPVNIACAKKYLDVVFGR